jgi:hypothetical protein
LASMVQESGTTRLSEGLKRPFGAHRESVRTSHPEKPYEGTEAVICQSLPCPFRTDAEERIVDSVRSQVKAAWAKSQSP